MKMNSHIRTWAVSGLMMLSAVALFTACDDDDSAEKFQPTTPVVQVEDATSYTLTFRWSPVEGAYEYAYTLSDDNGVYLQGDLTADTLVAFSDLEPATSYTLSVVAYAQDVMTSVASEAGVVTGMTAEPPVDDRLWEVKGVYTCAEWNQSWTATLIAYPDGVYKIESWLGVEGYDFDFTVDASGELVCDYPLDRYDYYCVPTGLTDYPTAYVYTDYQCSSFAGTEEAGNLFFYNYLYSGGYDTFVWGADVSLDDTTGGDDNTTDASTSAMAAVLGAYSEHTTGYWNADVDYTCDVVIEVADEATQTVVLKGFGGSSEALTGTVDLVAGTITFAPNQSFATYYLFSAEADQNTSVVATIAADGTISLSDWGAWYPYNGVYYTYAYGMTSVLTKK
jgi:hypothetical protein